MIAEIEQHREEIEALCRRYGVLRLEVLAQPSRVDFGRITAIWISWWNLNRDQARAIRTGISAFSKVSNTFSAGQQIWSSLPPSGILTSASR